MGNAEQKNGSVAPSEIEKCIDAFKDSFQHVTHQDMIDLTVPQSFEFSLPSYISYAKYALSKDEHLAQMRAKIVPIRLKEDVFWTKYFYKLQEFKNQAQKATSPKPAEVKKKKSSKKEESESELKSNEKRDDIFELVLQKPSVWLYQIPAKLWKGRNNKAEEWNILNPLWCGRMRIIAYEKGMKLKIQFLEPSGTIYLESVEIPLDKIDDTDNPMHHYFDAYGVADSSRYFVIWVETPGPKKVRVPFGFGMRERQDAFDIR
ncbi:hypothetical protein RFI_25892 [Reticulomyxa filosa]|uniref:BSD domain-containing protein n=1 Tax=Reticulomyxa filosa TaxID=46433 RepID=X6MCA0_RETFI|nr:hypothetical protein RFI_25892 [Reticulomyxa filosa]|eukprot:ETO11484.1 hypothetical protein RFI_25892 [Reticulomyxa filosa]